LIPDSPIFFPVPGSGSFQIESQNSTLSATSNTVSVAPIAHVFPTISLLISEIHPETGSHLTSRTANISLKTLFGNS
jgi:hypothetical protein